MFVAVERMIKYNLVCFLHMKDLEYLTKSISF